MKYLRRTKGYSLQAQIKNEDIRFELSSFNINSKIEQYGQKW